MIKIKKTLFFLGNFLLNIHLFSFEINDLKFGEKIARGETKIKEYVLGNNSLYSKIYKLEIEGKDKNIEVFPNLINLNSMESSKFEIRVLGNKPKGNYKYFLVIKEIKKEKVQNSVSLNKVVRIQQEYSIE